MKNDPQRQMIGIDHFYLNYITLRYYYTNISTISRLLQSHLIRVKSHLPFVNVFSLIIREE